MHGASKLFCITLLFSGFLFVAAADNKRMVNTNPLPEVLPIIPIFVFVYVTSRTTMAEVNVQVKRQCTVASNIRLNNSGTVLNNSEPCGKLLLEHGTIPIMVVVNGMRTSMSTVIIKQRQIDWDKRKSKRRKSM